MNFEFVPWPNFADRMLNELNSGGKLCDLMIGDSQWIGGAAENGHYVKLNDFFASQRHQDGRLHPGDRDRLFRMAEEHAELLGAAGLRRRGRLDLPQGLVRAARTAGRVQGEVWPRSGRADDLRRAEGHRRVLPGPRDRRQDGLRRLRSIPSAAPKASPWASMDVLYSYGFKYDNPDKPYDMEGFVNSPGAVAGLEFYKALYDCCTPPGSSNGYMGENIDAYKSGQVAMQMNFAFIWPGVRRRPERRRRQDRLFRQPGRPERRAVRPAWRAGHLGRVLLRKAGRGAGLHQVVRPAGGAGEVVERWAAIRRCARWSRTRASPPASPMRRPSSTRWRS